MPYIVISLLWAVQLLVNSWQTSVLIPVLSLMTTVTSSKLTSLGLAFLVSQRRVDEMNLPGLRCCAPRPGHSWLSIVHKISIESLSWP